MLDIKQEFKAAAIIKELNVLWQKYMGIPMPNAQSAERREVEEDGFTPTPVKPGLQF